MSVVFFCFRIEAVCNSIYFYAILHYIMNRPVVLSMKLHTSTGRSVERNLNISCSNSLDFRMYVLDCSQDLKS
jgi:hypothetical protein